MKGILKNSLNNPKGFAIGLIILSSIFLISLLFPKKGQFNYQYEIGKSWNYPDLVAPNTFYIWKTKSEISEEKKELQTRFKPVFSQEQDPSAIYQKWSDALETFRDQIANYDNLADFIATLKDKEILDHKDLNYRGVEYNTFFIETKTGYQEKRSDEFIEIDELKKTMSSLIGVSGDLPFINEVSAKINRSLTDAKWNIVLDDITAYKRKIKQGEVIVTKDELINERTFETLETVRVGSVQGNWHSAVVFIGYILLTCLIIGVYILYLLFHYPEVFYSTKKVGFLLMLIVFMSFLVYSVERSQLLSSYLIPFCIIPIVVKSFFSDRLALFTHIVIVLIASFLSVLDYEFTFLEILAGIVAVLVIEDTRSWNQFFISIFSIVAAYFIGYLGLCLIKYQVQVPIDWQVYKWLTISGVLTLLAYPFIPLLAKLFGFISSITLAELADLNKPLLKKLSIHAPGTMQHSLQVSNLSEAAADAIGANALLLKVGALYHDIGKLNNPFVFIENQNGINPHDNLSNFESARAIIAHVTDGVKMAKEARLPEVIVDLIKSHHGTTKVEYFFRNQKNQFPDKEFDESLFQYPGPKPKSKEETILMVADSLEAASKSLKNPTGQDIDSLVDSILDSKIKNNQFSDSSLSFEELGKCVLVFKSLLRSINHVRIEYPPNVEKSNIPSTEE